MTRPYVFLTSNNLFVRMLFGLLGAIPLSLFIYLYHYGIRNSLAFTVLGLMAISYYLMSNRKYRFFLGFFTGIAWFYWIPLSFRFFDLDGFIFIAIIAIGIFYGTLFYIALFTQNLIYRAMFLLFFPLIAPFGFDWFDFKIMFAPSILNVSLFGYMLILFAIFLFLYCKGSFRLLSILPLMLSLFVFPRQIQDTWHDFNIEIVSTNIPQQMKTDNQYLSTIVSENFQFIKKAIQEGKDIVVLPETAFLFPIEEHEKVLHALFELSQEIRIITGALRREGNAMYNTNYFFDKGEMQYADKQILVPFGEYMPLPSFLKKWLENYLNRGEFSKPPVFTLYDFEIDGINFRSAICYEATQKKIFADDPDYMIAISNNAWFTPSIQPSLQEIVMLTRAKEHGTIIYHSSNGAESIVINPFLNTY